ncbi:MFS transporter, DHA2 family, metal-tetracycline-proton antiporter [Paenibacillus sp. yr247]|uniref:MFS transporter n=1 Tax=Paenibacillus sp. yr247 TaxID=1761880 RepID=UPI00088480C2|nr:MFS transporter [Paenibacillus sp. yr247]SDO10356.1 MFS transporter, DHA2 family, metal-tetracycline-proton antiporter [Paenibacillus sp. yr247]
MKTSTDSPIASSQDSEVLRERLVLGLWSVAVMLITMNTTMFNVALPQIMKQFSLSSTTASWIVTGYSIVFAISSITFSRLSDYLPIRRLLAFGIICLSVGSLIGIFSHHFIMLFASRILQAIGAGSGISLGVMLVTRYIPMSRRGRSMSVIISTATFGMGLGPVLGGAITEYWGWNGLFVVTALIVLVLPLLFRLLPKEEAVHVRFDFAGALFIGVGVTGLLLFMTTASLFALAAGILFIIAFWMRIKRAKGPFVQPQLLRNMPYMLLSFIVFAAFAAHFATLFLMPLMLSRLYGLSSVYTGLIIFPGAILSALFSNVVGRMIDRYGNHLILRGGSIFMLLGAVLFGWLSSISPIAILFVYIPLSIGVTMLTTSVSNEMSRILPKEQIGAGIGLSQLIQFVGGAFGVALSGRSIAWQKSIPLSDAFTHIFWGVAVIVLLAGMSYLTYHSKEQSSLSLAK